MLKGLPLINILKYEEARIDLYYRRTISHCIFFYILRHKTGFDVARQI